MRKTCDKPRRRGAVPAFREHLVHCAAREATLQHGIRLIMAKRRPVRHSTGAIGLDPRDTIAQARKRPRACMCSGHAPLPCLSEIKKSVTSEPMTSLNVHYMF